MPASAKTRSKKRRTRRPLGLFVDAALLVVLATYLVAAWRVRAVGMRRETDPVMANKACAGQASLCLDTRLSAPDTALELLLYRRVGGLHVLEYRTRLASVGTRLRFVYPLEDSRAAYTVVLRDTAGRWARLAVTAASGKPSIPTTLRLLPAPAEWFL